MRLSTFSDYSLRALMYLSLQPDRLATIAEIAEAYDISEAHLMKVIHHLGRAGFIETVRGKGGGVRLGRAPKDIVLGQVIRQTESDMDLTGCFSRESYCRLQGACRLNAILGEGLKGMFLVLDAYTLADLVEQPHGLAKAVNLQAA